MTIENSNITADVIEAQEFPELAKRYGVRGVPKTIINESVEFVGALPENIFISYIKSALGDGDANSDSE